MRCLSMITVKLLSLFAGASLFVSTSGCGSSGTTTGKTAALDSALAGKVMQGVIGQAFELQVGKGMLTLTPKTDLDDVAVILTVHHEDNTTEKIEKYLAACGTGRVVRIPTKSQASIQKVELRGGAKVRKVETDLAYEWRKDNAYVDEIVLGREGQRILFEYQGKGPLREINATTTVQYRKGPTIQSTKVSGWDSWSERERKPLTLDSTEEIETVVFRGTAKRDGAGVHWELTFDVARDDASSKSDDALSRLVGNVGGQPLAQRTINPGSGAGTATQLAPPPRSIEDESDAVEAIEALDGHVAGKGDLTSVVVVDLNGTKATDATLKELTSLKSLRSLFLEGTQITDAGLAEVKRLDHLALLVLTDTKTTDMGLRELAGLKELQMLILDGTQITDTGLRELSQLDSVEELSLGGTQITDVGLAAVARLKGVKKLQLSGTKITDVGLKNVGQTDEVNTPDPQRHAHYRCGDPSSVKAP